MHGRGWCEKCEKGWHLITLWGWGKIREEKNEAVWSSGGGCLSLCQIPLRVVHLVLFPSLLGLSVKILSGHNFQPWCAAAHFLDTLSFSLLLLCLIYHLSISLRIYYSRCQSSRHYIQLRHGINPNSPDYCVLILHVSFFSKKRAVKESSQERSHTWWGFKTLSQQTCPAHCLLYDCWARAVFPFWTMPYYLTFLYYCHTFFFSSTSLGSLLGFPFTGFITITVQHIVLVCVRKKGTEVCLNPADCTSICFALINQFF